MHTPANAQDPRASEADPASVDWNDLRLFATVARHGTQLGAARELGVDHATVGRRLKSLEARLGVPLLERRDRRLYVTKEGHVLLDRIIRMEALALEALRRLGDSSQLMSGVVRISATEGVAAYWLADHLVAIQRENPGLTIDVSCTAVRADLGRGEADIALRYGPPTAPGDIVHAVLRIRFGLFAAQGYADVYGVPETWEDLGDHRLLDLEDHHANPLFGAWSERLRRQGLMPMRTNSATVYGSAMRAGMGIGLAPVYTMRDMAAVPLDPGIETLLHLVSHERSRGNPRVQLVVRRLRAAFEETRRRWAAEEGAG
jgi:DNA-binding transcriptional LysR family regulator